MIYGNWTVLCEFGKDKSGNLISQCRCKCGYIKLVQNSSLKNGKSKGCNSCRKLNCMKKKHVGKVFGKLKIIDQIPGKKCVCICLCGNKKIFRTSSVICGHTRSCGCISSISRKNYNEYAKEKLLENIKLNENGCWEWQRTKNKQGYGRFPYKRKLFTAHRVSWILFNGEIEDGVLVCHSCDNPCCCNPEHLFLGDDKTNAEDRVRKNRCNHKKGKNHWCSKLKEEDIPEIRRMGNSGKTDKEIGEKFRVHKSTIWCILNKKTWTHVL